jgi:murein DD-endopeptidase MepM/ murein hydrolase activator NlpD
MTSSRLVSILGWVLAIGAVGAAVFVWQNPERFRSDPVVASDGQVAATSTPEPTESLSNEAPAPVVLPTWHAPMAVPESVDRDLSARTIIPDRPSTEILLHIVQSGDSLFGIANGYNIEPETVLWANYELLDDNPDFLEAGMELSIPPVNGVYYEWQEGDTLDGVAAAFEAQVENILGFSSNVLDLADLHIEPGTQLMIPGGRREFRQWLIPTIARGSAGVNTSALGPGACTGSYEGLYGSGGFIWPSSNHFISGNDYWSGHLAIDIAVVEGQGILASDAGVVVFSGWAVGGYGNMIMVDHGNGFQTLYAHLSGVVAPCGASVVAGQTVGLGGSTGNSTGSHLHFEVRSNGGFINPWFVLPPP